MPRSSQEISKKQLEEFEKELPKSKIKELREDIEDRKEKLEIELGEEHKKSIKNQIEDDVEEISAFNIIISAFRTHDIYSFIRSEPLIYDGLKNFDILVGSKKKDTGLLIEYERTLLSDLYRKLREFFQERDVIKKNKADFNVKEKLNGLIGAENPDFDFVITSTQLKENKLEKKAKELNENYISWGISKSGNKCRMYYHVNKESKEANFKGHTDPELTSYIADELKKGKPYLKKIAFTYSTSRYLKLKETAIVFSQKSRDDNTFDYDRWKDTFNVELFNYSEEEKKTIYKNTIEYGLKCNLFNKDEDKGDIFIDKFSVRSRYTSNIGELKKEILSKMKSKEMEEELKEKLAETKKDIIMKYYREYSTGGTTLDDFS